MPAETHLYNMPTDKSAVDLASVWLDERRIEDNWSSIYDHVYHDVQYCYRLYKERVADLVQSAWKERGGRVLEVGCGTGAVLATLAHRGIPQSQLSGVDISPLMVAEAQAKLPGAGFAAVPFEQFEPSQPYECVYFCGALHHLADKRIVAERLNAIMPPGAALLVCEPNGQWMFSRLFWKRAVRLVTPVWMFWRLVNHRRVVELAKKQEGKGDPAFHEHITASDIEQAFNPYFELIGSHTSFAITRLHEGVVLDPGLTVKFLGILDTIANVIAPQRGGSIHMTFRKRR